MPFDGTAAACITHELDRELTGGRISRISQPEPDAIMLTIKNHSKDHKLYICANAGLPLIYLTQKTRPNPAQAPNFCMLLRKHLSGGRICEISQPSLERVIMISIEHTDELGDECRRILIAELMGKYSNIILCGSDGIIIDSIKRVPQTVSSVREVLPGREYFIPNTQSKLDPFSIASDDLLGGDAGASASQVPLYKALYGTYTGFSPVISLELCRRAGLDPDKPVCGLSQDERGALFEVFRALMDDIQAARFSPAIYMDGDEPAEFGAVELTHLSFYSRKPFDSMSRLLETYYGTREANARIRQRSADLRHIVQTILDRDRKKYDLQQKQLKDTQKRGRYRLYGELLNAYGYSVPPGSRSFTADDYYTGNKVEIPLDPTLTAQQNAQHYFERYAKLKRTDEALTRLTIETQDEIEYLCSVQTSLDLAETEADLDQIRDELRVAGYIKKKGRNEKKSQSRSAPLHFVSSDGYDIYVGKNNLQNEELTFGMASGADLWFHAKKIPGSHVIVKTGGKAKEDLPDRLFTEAASLAAYYSAGRGSDKVEIDYVEKKQLRKVAGARPGFVIYHTNYSMVAEPRTL